MASLICFSSISQAAPPHGVKYTAHNLGTTGRGLFAGVDAGTTETEICIFCHTPHNAAAGKKFLWNRLGTTTQFALYTSSPTLNISQADKAVGISEVSKMCLTCHDGATAMNSMANPRPGITTMAMGDVWNENLEWGKNIGERSGVTGDMLANTANLTNDHPISFSYTAVQALDPTIKLKGAADGPTANGLVFWGPNSDMLECVTCHDPHINYGSYNWREAPDPMGIYDATLAPFLRRSNRSSGLCFSCHDK